jgi:universal stress protein A
MTSTVQNILLPTDFSACSQRAIEYASALARKLGAAVHLVHVLEEPFTTKGAWEFHRPDTPELRERMYQDCRARLATVADKLHDDNVSQVTTEVRSGTPTDAIVAAAVDYGADLIVMATHVRSGLPHLLLGSVAERVIRHARCPVLAVRESGAARMHAAADKVA